MSFQRLKICHGDFLFSNIFITIDRPRIVILDFGLSHKMLPADSSMKRSHRDRFRFTSEFKDLIKLKEIARYLKKELSSISSKASDMIEGLNRASSQKDLIKLVSCKKFANLQKKKIPLDMHAILKKIHMRKMILASFQATISDKNNRVQGSTEKEDTSALVDLIDSFEENWSDYQLSSSSSNTSYLASLPYGYGPELLPYRGDSFVDQMETFQVPLILSNEGYGDKEKEKESISGKSK